MNKNSTEESTKEVSKITLYNTLGKEKQNFTPITPNKVGMYHCGPTVYDYPHIGNLRSYVFADTLRRVFELLPIRVQVQDLLGGVMMQRARWHRGKRIANANKSAYTNHC